MPNYQAEANAAGIALRLATENWTADQLRELADRVDAEANEAGYVPLREALHDDAIWLRQQANQHG
jgi:hypothetical protein